MNFYNHFLRGKSKLAEVLYRLLDANVVWQWGEEHQRSFDGSKTLSTSESALVHFNESAPLVLSCDVSPAGVGALLAHRGHQGREKSVAYASRTLSKTKRNHARIDREELAVVFGGRHFHKYLCGRECLILTDQKPLLENFQPQKQILAVLSPCILRWTLILSAYECRLEYCRSQDHANADCLSRFPVFMTNAEAEAPGDLLLMEAVQYPPGSAAEMASCTLQDQQLSQVKQWIVAGWPREGVPEEYAG